MAIFEDWTPPHARLQSSSAFYCVISQLIGPVAFLATSDSEPNELVAFLRDWLKARSALIEERASVRQNELVAFIYLVLRKIPPDRRAESRLGIVLADPDPVPGANGGMTWAVSEFGRGTADIGPAGSSDRPLVELLEFALADLHIGRTVDASWTPPPNE